MHLQSLFRQLGSKETSEKSQRFFKTGKGEYGEGDVFLGIRSPVIRSFEKEHQAISLKDTQKFVKSKFHEERLLGMIILVNKYKRTKSEDKREEIYQFYLDHFEFINNWDLVDVSCPHIVGKHLLNRDRSVLYVWAKSDHLWTKRIAMITNWFFIRSRDLNDVFAIAEILLKDDHDLIHKAVGWMLREAGKKDLVLTELFMKKHYQLMPRTMLRYAIEKYPEKKRKMYLNGQV